MVEDYIARMKPRHDFSHLALLRNCLVIGVLVFSSIMKRESKKKKKKKQRTSYSLGRFLFIHSSHSFSGEN
jgi:hypothetical protein